MTSAGVVLAGGRSTRLGRDKAMLAWAGTTLVAHVAGVLVSAVEGPVVVMRGMGQSTPVLPPTAEVGVDPWPDLGPLQGMVAGLAAIGSRADSAFVAATDLPFLDAGTVRSLLDTLQHRPGVEVVAVSVDGHPQWLAAAYRATAGAVLAAALESGERRVRTAVRACRTLLLSPEDLGVDPVAFTNLNDARAYERARDANRG